MQTWIAIGGFDFSNPGPTHTTWSDMVSTSANRARFISSLIDFMTRWGFQGAELDWEYPAFPARGGSPDDTQNLVSLVAEMRTVFGTTYGISVTL
jgi:GH18 family chitinase